MLSKPDASSYPLIMIQDKHLQPVMDIDPWPKGLGFRNAEDWWFYVQCQCEENKVELLMTAAILSQKVCQRLLTHDQLLFDRFHLSPQTIAQLCTIHASSLSAFATIWLEQNKSMFKGSI